MNICKAQDTASPASAQLPSVIHHLTIYAKHLIKLEVSTTATTQGFMGKKKPYCTLDLCKATGFILKKKGFQVFDSDHLSERLQALRLGFIKHVKVNIKMTKLTLRSP